MNVDRLRFHVMAEKRPDQRIYFCSWFEGQGVWSEEPDKRRSFWMMDEAEAVIRCCGFGAVVIEEVAG